MITDHQFGTSLSSGPPIIGAQTPACLGGWLSLDLLAAVLASFDAKNAVTRGSVGQFKVLQAKVGDNSLPQCLSSLETLPLSMLKMQ